MPNNPPNLSRDELNRLVSLLESLPAFQDDASRRTFLLLAGLANVPLSLPPNLATRTYATLLVDGLQKYGKVTQTDYAVGLLLKGLIDQNLIGGDSRAFVADLLARYEGSAQAGGSQGAVADGTVRILLLSANPTETPRLSLDEEIRLIKDRLNDRAMPLSFALINEGAVRVSDISLLLARHNPQIVHFSGHGTPTQELILYNDAGQAQPVNPAAFAMYFSFFKSVKLVTLNACWSEPLADAITAFVPCAVGMTQEMGDISARVFSGKLYQMLGYKRSAAEAFALARTDLLALSSDFTSVPQIKGEKCNETFLG